MTNEYFPIKRKPACKSKWAWSTIWFHDGTTASCHRCDRHKIDIDDFDNFHNTAPKIEQRNAMLNGTWPKSGGCDFCKNVEAAGGFSDRQFQLTIPNQTPPELFENRMATVVTPTIIEVFLANTCNLQCTYCHPKNSSKIQREFEKYGPYETPVYSRKGHDIIVKPIDEADLLREKFWDWMSRKSDALRRFHILGGEPLYQKDVFWKCLTHWEEYPNPLVEINVVSNLSIPEKQFQKYLEYTKELYKNGKIKRFDITASIDCWGDDQAYARQGIDMDLFERNMEYLLEQDEDWLRININQTISALTIKSMPELIKKLNSWKDRRSVIGHYAGTVIGMRPLEPTIFPKGYWDETFDEVIGLMRDDSWDDKAALQMMKGTASQVCSNSEYDPEAFANLIKYLNELDMRRGTNWRNAFPYLLDLLD
jgi:pyruvate-formate lyase-activating enzyme